MIALRALATRWRLTGVDLAVIGYGFAYVLLLLLVPQWPGMMRAAVVMYFPMGAIALAAQLSAARAPTLAPADRRAWRWIAVGSGLVWLSGLIWTTALRTGAARFSTPAFDGALDVVASACLIVGMLHFPTTSRTRRWSARMGLEAALFGVAWLIRRKKQATPHAVPRPDDQGP